MFCFPFIPFTLVLSIWFLSCCAFTFHTFHLGFVHLACLMLCFHLSHLSPWLCPSGLSHVVLSPFIPFTLALSIWLVSCCAFTFHTFHLGVVHPLQDVARHQCLPSSSVCCFPVPSFFVMSSCHLLLGRPFDLFPFIGCHSVQCLVHLLSFIHAHVVLGRQKTSWYIYDKNHLKRRNPTLAETSLDR